MEVGNADALADAAQQGPDMPSVLSTPVLPAEGGAATAAMDILRLAQRTAGTLPELREQVVRSHTWSHCNRPLLWSAAADDATHPVVEWLCRAASGSWILLPGLRDAAMPGPAAVREAWLALREGMRALGIASKSDLADWHRRSGYGTVACSSYLQAPVQMHLLVETTRAIGYSGVDSPMEAIYGG
eukprot:12035608-Karenia_brevis.AAC.1